MSDTPLKSICCNADVTYYYTPMRKYHIDGVETECYGSAIVCDKCRKSCKIKLVGKVPEHLLQQVLDEIETHNKKFNSSMIHYN